MNHYQPLPVESFASGILPHKGLMNLCGSKNLLQAIACHCEQLLSTQNFCQSQIDQPALRSQNTVYDQTVELSKISNTLIFEFKYFILGNVKMNIAKQIKGAKNPKVKKPLIDTKTNDI